MTNLIETVRVSEKGKQQLSRLKRSTGIENWNTLCRWALCVSLAEPSIPPREEIPADGITDMTWRTFANQHGDIYEAIIKQRLIEDKIPIEEVHLWFRIHLHRGISYIAGKNLIQLMELHRV